MGISISCCTCISNEGIGSTSIKQEECRFSSSKEGYVLEGLIIGIDKTQNNSFDMQWKRQERTDE